MPFLIPFIPAIIGAAGAIGGGILGKKSSHSGLEGTLQDMMSKDAGTRDKIIGDTAGPLSYFTGSDPTQSGLYKSLVTTGTESTARAYDNAKSNLRQRANTAGFGYAQPVEQGGETSLGNEEAKAMTDVPRKALMDTIQPELSALNIRANEAHNYDPGQYVSGAAGLEQSRQQQQGGLFSNLLGLAGKYFKPGQDQTQSDYAGGV
jgi:hypothetical protein